MTLPADLPASTATSTAAPLVWSDPARGALLNQWLGSVAPSFGLDASTLRLASADASFRRYFRINTQDGQSRVIMDAPPALENSQPFVAVAQLMHQAGVRAPDVLSWHEADGFMLLSDLGTQTMMEVIKKQPALDVTPQKTEVVHRLYMNAVDQLIRWQLASRPGVLPAYDDALLSRELQLFPDWYLAKHRGVTVDAALEAKLQEVFAQIKDSNLNALGGAKVFVHRDFMPRNLMTPTLGTGAPLDPEAPLGVLDFQDAVYGPITYDIASLMRDAFLSWDEEFVLDITVRYWQKARTAGLPVGDDFGEFYRAVEWMGLQRHLKILGIFARLTLRDGKAHYLADTPRFIHYVRTTADRYRQLGPFLKLLDEIEGTTPQVGFAYGRM